MFNDKIMTQCRIVVYRKMGYNVGLNIDGKYIASKDVEPIFCIEGNEETEVIIEANKAIDFYIDKIGDPE